MKSVMFGSAVFVACAIGSAHGQQVDTYNGRPVAHDYRLSARKCDNLRADYMSRSMDAIWERDDQLKAIKRSTANIIADQLDDYCR